MLPLDISSNIIKSNSIAVLVAALFMSIPSYVSCLLCYSINYILLYTIGSDIHAYPS